MKHKKLIGAVIAVLIPALLIGIVLANAFWSALYPGCVEYPSPAGDYVVVERFTDFLAIGYRGRSFLRAEGREYYIDNWGPATIRWLTDETFEVKVGFDNLTYDAADIMNR